MTGQTQVVASETRTFVIPMPNGREALIQTPTDLTLPDYQFLTAYLALMKDALIGSVSQPTRAMAVKTGPAIWHHGGVDHPVVVTGYAGEEGGQVYVKTDGHDSAVPLDEIVYEG